MNRREFVGSAGVVVGTATLAGSVTSGEPSPKLIQATITAIKSIGHAPGGEIQIETSQHQEGWVRLGDGAQDQRVWACLTAVWLALQVQESQEALKKPGEAGVLRAEAKIHFESYTRDGKTGSYNGVKHVHLRGA